MKALSAAAAQVQSPASCRKACMRGSLDPVPHELLLVELFSACFRRGRARFLGDIFGDGQTADGARRKTTEKELGWHKAHNRNTKTTTWGETHSKHGRHETERKQNMVTCRG